MCCSLLGFSFIDACMQTAEEAARRRGVTWLSDDQVINICKLLLVVVYVTVAYVSYALGMSILRVTSSLMASVSFYGSTFLVVSILKTLLDDSRCSWSGVPVSISGHFFFFLFFVLVLPADAFLHLACLHSPHPASTTPVGQAARQSMVSAAHRIFPSALISRAVACLELVHRHTPTAPRAAAPTPADVPVTTMARIRTVSICVYVSTICGIAAYLMFLAIALVHGYRTYAWGYHSLRQVMYGCCAALLSVAALLWCGISRRVVRTRADPVGDRWCRCGAAASMTVVGVGMGGGDAADPDAFARPVDDPLRAGGDQMSPFGVDRDDDAYDAIAVGVDVGALHGVQGTVYCCCARARLAGGALAVALILGLLSNVLKSWTMARIQMLFGFAIVPTLITAVLARIAAVGSSARTSTPAV